MKKIKTFRQLKVGDIILYAPHDGNIKKGIEVGEIMNIDSSKTVYIKDIHNTAYKKPLMKYPWGAGNGIFNVPTNFNQIWILNKKETENLWLLNI